MSDFTIQIVDGAALSIELQPVPGTGTVPPAVEVGLINGAPGVSGATFSQPGTVIVAVGESRYYMSQSGSLTGVIVSVGTAPTSSGLTIDVLKNGVSIFNTPPTIPVGQHKVQITPNVVSFATGDYYTVSVTVADGANLVVQLLYV